MILDLLLKSIYVIFFKTTHNSNIIFFIRQREVFVFIHGRDRTLKLNKKDTLI